MVDYQSSALDMALYALSDRTRRGMLAQLAKKECTVSELAEPFAMTLAAVSKHLKVLEEAQFVIKRREGRTFRCQINPGPFRDVAELLAYYESFWTLRLAALDDFLTNQKKKKRDEHPRTRKGRTKGRRKANH